MSSGNFSWVERILDWGRGEIEEGCACGVFFWQIGGDTYEKGGNTRSPVKLASIKAFKALSRLPHFVVRPRWVLRVLGG